MLQGFNSSLALSTGKLWLEQSEPKYRLLQSLKGFIPLRYFVFICQIQLYQRKK